MSDKSKKPPSIVYLDPRQLCPYTQNPKQHPDEQITKITQLINRFGFPDCKAIAIDEDGVILHGHGRQLAAIAAGLTEVPVQVMEGLTDSDKRAWRIADNAVAESPWDWSILKEELDQLEQLGGDLDLVGLSEEMMQDLRGDDLEDTDYQAPETGKTQEIDPEEDFDLGHTCPRCGFEFDD